MSSIPSKLLCIIGILFYVLQITNGFLISRGWLQNGRTSALAPLQSSKEPFKKQSSSGNGNSGKYSNTRNARKDSNRGGVQLDKAEGARPLTKSELKAKEQYEATREPTVERILPKFSPLRTKFVDLTQGQKLKGRVISIKDYGMFIDIGAERDGLVHVKDISKDYFIQNHASKFAPGQDLDVWIKFVVKDEEDSKLGLQMFPVSKLAKQISREDALANLSNLKVGDAVSGTVMRVSNYGVYVDIGHGVEAYLHKRKMKVGRKMISLKPWEIAPVGASMDGYIHEVSVDRARIAMTTYPPEQWNEKLPAKDKSEDGDETVENDDDDDDDEDDDNADDENAVALKRIMALDVDQDDEEEDSSAQTISVTDLTPAEIRALQQKRAGRMAPPGTKGRGALGQAAEGQVVLNDFQGAGVSPQGKGAKTTLAPRIEAPDNEYELSTSELFNEISYNRPTIVYKDLKNWEYMANLLQTEVITEAQVKELISIHGEAGRLNEEQFEGFLETLVDGLDFGEEDGEIDGDEYIDEEETLPESMTVLMDDTDSEPTRGSKTTRATVYNDDEGDDMSIGSSYVRKEGSSAAIPSTALAKSKAAPKVTEGDAPSLADLSKTKPKTSDLFNYVFSSVGGKKGYVLQEDVLAWDFVKALVAKGDLSEKQALALFEKACKGSTAGGASGPKSKGPKVIAADSASFDRFVAALSTTQGTPSSPTPTKPAAEAAAKKEESSFDENFEEFMDEDNEQTVDEVFAELSNGKGTISFDSLVRWDVMQELLEGGALSEAKLKDLFSRSGAKGRKTLTIDQFETLLDLLAPFAEEEGEDDAVELEVSAAPPVPTSTSKAAKSASGPSAARSNTKEPSSGKQPTKMADEDGDQENDDDDDDIEEDRKLVEGVFGGIAGGKKTASIKDLMGWDLVLDLMGEGLLSEETLRQMVTSVGGGAKGVLIDQFSDLVDRLVELYEVGDEDEEEEDGEDEEIEEGEGLNLSEEEGGEDDEDEYYQVDMEEDFSALAKGGKTITFAKLQEWELLQQMQNEGLLSDATLRDACKKAGVSNLSKINIDDFKSILYELENGAEDYVDEIER